MPRGRQGIRQLTALLVLTIVTAASGLPHWHVVPAASPAGIDLLLAQSRSGTDFLVSASSVDLLECAACVLQRILTQARTQGTQAPPRPSLQAEIVSTAESRVSRSPLRLTDSRGPPWS